MSSSAPITTLSLPSLEKVASGKVRDLFALPEDPTSLLFVATDRISAYDVILKNGIPNKGAVLTLLSNFWFRLLSERVPDLRTHFLSLGAPATLPLTPAERALTSHRAMRVRRLKVFPVEAIVRGYLAGSGYAEYAKSSTVHGIPLPAGLRRCEKLPTPLYTPSTKADQGQHDENIHPDAAAALVGAAYAPRIERLALALYSAAAEYALARGVIIADTKFEFGLDEDTDEVVLVDETLTPDSSRFWPADRYEVGREQESFDKQFVRDWLVEHGLKGVDGVAVPDHVAVKTGEKYREIFEKLTGEPFEDAVARVGAA
ncbi:hypothetical protein ACHAQH_002481 [Verticillium albo-atrum]